MEFKGQCVGVKLYKRGQKDNHICLELMIEDDENWFTKDFSISSFWIDELIDVLEAARAYMKTQKPDISKDNKQYGYKFK